MISICQHCGNEFETNRKARKYCSLSCANRASGEAVKSAAPTGKVYAVWSSGGGVQSTAIAALIEMGKLPKPDYGLMIDCGYEKEGTMKYMREVTVPRMEAIGVPFFIVDTLDYSNNKLTDGSGHINIPAFKLMDDGKVSKLRTHCNNAWKVQVMRKWLRERGVVNCENWLGISTDEEHRAKPSSLKWIQHRYPLIEMGLNREDCIYAIAEAGWPMPARSSCVFCPQQSNAEWRKMKNESGTDWELALRIEKEIQREVPNAYLHYSCKCLTEIFG
jgi:hypothetical protein